MLRFFSLYTLVQFDDYLFFKVVNEKTKQMIALRYFTDKYLSIFHRVTNEDIKYSDEEKAHLKIESNFQKQCPKNVSQLSFKL